MINVKGFLAGRFRWELRDPDGNLVQSSGWINNKILDEGLHLLGSGGPDGDIENFGRIYIGQGNAPVLESDLSLDNILDDTYHGPRDESLLHMDNRYDYKASLPYYRSVQGHAVRFGPFVQSANVAEVGLGRKKDNIYYMLTRALIKDTDGTVTTVSVPTGFYFDVFYELWQLFPINDETYQVNLDQDGSMVAYNVTSRLALAGNEGYGKINDKVTRSISDNTIFGWYSLVTYNGGLRAVTSFPEYTANQYGNYAYNDNVRWTYDRDTMTSRTTFELNEQQGNHTNGLRSVLIKTTRGCYQIQFEKVADGAPLPKNDHNTLSFNFSVSWQRYNGTLQE